MITIKVELHDQEDAENLSLMLATFVGDFETFVGSIIEAIDRVDSGTS